MRRTTTDCWLTIFGATKDASTIRFWGGGPGEEVVALMTSVSPLGTSWQMPRNQEPIAIESGYWSLSLAIGRQKASWCFHPLCSARTDTQRLHAVQRRWEVRSDDEN